MTDNEKQIFLQNYNDKNNLLIGNTIITPVTIEYIDGEGYTLGQYYSSSSSIKIEAVDLDNFYGTINVIVHEGSGHGYQDYVMRYKDEYLKNHPLQKDDIRIFELSYDSKVAPNAGVNKKDWSYDVYFSDPAEIDARNIGETIQKAASIKKKQVDAKYIGNIIKDKISEEIYTILKIRDEK